MRGAAAPDHHGYLARVKVELLARNEALLEGILRRTRTTKHPWLIACDANMSPEDFEKSLWFRKDQMHVIAPEGVSTCRSKSAEGECEERVCDYVKACRSQTWKFSDVKVIEDFESRPHKAVTFVVKRGKENRNGTSKNCRRRHGDTVEEGYQEKARKRKEKTAKEANKGRRKTR